MRPSPHWRDDRSRTAGAAGTRNRRTYARSASACSATATSASIANRRRDEPRLVEAHNELGFAAQQGLFQRELLLDSVADTPDALVLVEPGRLSYANPVARALSAVAR